MTSHSCSNLTFLARHCGIRWNRCRVRKPAFLHITRLTSHFPPSRPFTRLSNQPATRQTQKPPSLWPAATVNHVLCSSHVLVVSFLPVRKLQQHLQDRRICRITLTNTTPSPRQSHLPSPPTQHPHSLPFSSSSQNNAQHYSQSQANQHVFHNQCPQRSLQFAGRARVVLHHHYRRTCPEDCSVCSQLRNRDPRPRC